MSGLSPRLAAVVEALPLEPGMRVVEIGCGPGAAARAVCERVGPAGHVLAVDRSERAIAQLEGGAAALIAAGRLTPRVAKVEELALAPGEEPYELAFAVRVGALDGRDPAAGRLARVRLREVLAPGGRLFADGGDPLRELELGPPGPAAAPDVRGAGRRRRRA